ncbi:MAG: EAL domain-containing protein [Ruminococcus sp.]|nr:EAL domain-containing protein [Ruminococcus sp.]
MFEQLIQKLNSQITINFEELVPYTTAVCRAIRVEKIVTTTYANAKLEALGRGDELVAYDSGEKCIQGLYRRIVNNMMNVIICRVYIKEGAEPWTEEEITRIRMYIETMSVYVSRSKITAAAEKYAFLDDDGYHNLRYIIRYIQRSMESGGLNGMAAIHFNLKHFSLVNQQIGRKAGSLVMLGFFKQIEHMIDDKGAAGRMGGDNFVAMVKVEMLEEVLNALAGIAVVYDPGSGERIMVSATAGVFIIPDGFTATDVGDILDKIIAASTVARTKGTADVVYFSSELAEEKEKLSRLQRLFPDALVKEEFKVYYQPKIDISTGELIGAEALCRWFRGDRLIPPDAFIPLLEMGLDICKLDFYMLDHVCRDIRRWLDEGRRVVRVSVNLSRKHMMDVDLLQHIIDTVDRNNVPHEYVEVELTETTTDVEFRDLKRVVSGLQSEGICTSVDDFGMGYSSLNLIKEMPWNVLKIDRSFLPVDGESENSTRSVMFKYVVAMAKDLGLECIAEGVETEKQVELLKHNDCELAQGFFFDRPLPTEEFEKRLDQYHYSLSGEAWGGKSI